jgi:excinuclease UvrABC nuclease subunit
MLRFTHENTLKPVVPAKPGIYKFYDNNKRLLYVGHAKNLRHRVQSYRQDDDFREHPTKAALRPRIKYYAYENMPVERARRLEREIKKNAPHNYL